jgi:hypothetical protein
MGLYDARITCECELLFPRTACWVRDGARARLAGPRVQNTGRQRVAPSGRCRTALSFVSLDRWQHPPFLAFLYTARFCEGTFLESPECPQAPSTLRGLHLL